MTNPQQQQGNQGLDQYNQGGGRYTSPEEALKQELIDQGYDPNSTGFWDTLNNMIAQAKANTTANQQRTEQSQQLSQDVEFRSGLQPSDADYQGIDHAELQKMVQSVNPSQVTGVSTSWTQLANAMATFGQQLGQAATKSGATWKGDAAESAYNFVSGLGTWSDQSGQAAQLAADQVYSQSSAAETAKNSMPEPIPFSWTDEMKSWASSNPFNLVDNIDKSYQKQQESQDAHDQAAQVMSSYDNNLYTAASKAPAFNPPPTFDSSGGTSVGSISGAIEGTATSSYNGAGGNIGASGGTGGTQGGQVSGGSSGSLSGSLSTPAVTPTLNSGVKTGGSTTPGTTSAQGYQPTSGDYTSSTTSGLGQTGLGAMGGMPMGGMGGGFGGGDGDEYSSKLGRGGSGGGFGPGGSSSGSAASSGSAGAGAQSGARAGGAGAAETAAGGSGRGAAGSAGRSGAGGMGHGGKGQGGEDEEHERPSWLIEPDPDEIFGTSERTAPPVIGE
jgi:hypothetical protein